MYKYDEIELTGAMRDSSLLSFVPKPIPPAARKIEVWCSSISDPGDDFTEYRYLTARGTVLATRRVKGY